MLEIGQLKHRVHGQLKLVWSYVEKLLRLAMKRKLDNLELVVEIMPSRCETVVRTSVHLFEQQWWIQDSGIPQLRGSGIGRSQSERHGCGTGKWMWNVVLIQRAFTVFARDQNLGNSFPETMFGE